MFTFNFDAFLAALQGFWDNFLGLMIAFWNALLGTFTIT